jgi:hypothetical protein
MKGLKEQTAIFVFAIHAITNVIIYPGGMKNQKVIACGDEGGGVSTTMTLGESKNLKKKKWSIISTPSVKGDTKSGGITHEWLGCTQNCCTAFVLNFI